MPVLLFLFGFGRHASVAGFVRTSEVVAVLSSDSYYYEEAFNGFREAFDRDVTVLYLNKGALDIGKTTKIVVTFGGKAALQSYPEEIQVINCLASVSFERGRHMVIQMMPAPHLLLSKIKEIQPTIKRLAVFWMSDFMRDYVQRMEQASFAFDVKIISEKLVDAVELPDELRKISGKVDAIWLPSDPLLVTVRNFTMIKDFSWANGVPFYVPTIGLAEKGATGAVYVSYQEMGRLAALEARKVLSGESTGDEIFPEALEVTVNLTAAKKAGLEVPQEVNKKFNRIIQ